MTKGALVPLGGKCALATARTTSLGTATACPSPNDWQSGEQAVYQIQDPPGAWQAIYHDRSPHSTASLSMDCWSRAASIGLVN